MLNNKQFFLPLVLSARISVPLKNVSVAVGKDFKLSCPVTGIPIIIVSWRIKSGTNPAFVKNTLLLNNNRTLYISNVTVNHTGWYSCIAENKYGIDKSSAWLQSLGEFYLINIF